MTSNKYFYYFHASAKSCTQEDPDVRSNIKVYLIHLQTKQILERHLVIADQAYTMSKLREISNDTIYLTAARDILKIRVKEYGESE